MSHQFPQSIEAYFPKVISLNPLLQDAIKNQDQETLLGLSKIICSLCENHTRLLLAKFDPFGIQLVQMVLSITSLELQYPTEEMASPISFSFWYSLQELNLKFLFITAQRKNSFLLNFKIRSRTNMNRWTVFVSRAGVLLFKDYFTSWLSG